ncbi:hypothetical protein [Ensifer sesbaniae]|uniref:hypothetical protein n=1 Tax=Ensifer sesbaniae TaxID=1214071 RepID=UPI001568AC86|nr:hypothetical protein [Ensifer sesbaniae]NRQ19069.1 hypothetical protein [Ensifer sesbaniae]
MGLDMYACTLRESPADFEVEEATALHYWREHPDLHGWMERLYREEGATHANFNCINLQLTADDLERTSLKLARRIRRPSCWMQSASGAIIIFTSLMKAPRAARHRRTGRAPCGGYHVSQNIPRRSAARHPFIIISMSRWPLIEDRQGRLSCGGIKQQARQLSAAQTGLEIAAFFSRAPNCTQLDVRKAAKGVWRKGREHAQCAQSLRPWAHHRAPLNQ